MKLWAAKYYLDSSETEYDIVLYESKKIAQEGPHDYIMNFTKSQWKKMGCRLPRKMENMAIELIAKEII
jgi:homoaconitase/3-isopropylmalate dehydratase large subunit